MGFLNRDLTKSKTAQHHKIAVRIIKLISTIFIDFQNKEN